LGGWPGRLGVLVKASRGRIYHVECDRRRWWGRGWRPVVLVLLPVAGGFLAVDQVDQVAFVPGRAGGEGPRRPAARSCGPAGASPEGMPCGGGPAPRDRPPSGGFRTLRSRRGVSGDLWPYGFVTIDAATPSDTIWPRSWRPGLPETDKSGFAAMMTAVAGRWWRPSFRTRVARVGVVGPTQKGLLDSVAIGSENRGDDGVRVGTGTTCAHVLNRGDGSRTGPPPRRSDGRQPETFSRV
jgi:hypothetical protein